MLSKHTIRSGVYFMLLFMPDSVTSNYFTTATGYYKMQISINGLYDTNYH